MRTDSLRLLAVLALSAGLAACDTGNRSSADLESESEDARIDEPALGEEDAIGTSGMQTTAAGMDQSFGHFAAMTNQAEIELGRLAQEKSQNQQVRDYASQLVNDHTKAMQELQNVASIPDEVELDRQHQQLHDRLSMLSGEEFDREFMRAMVEGHQKAVERFQQAAGTSATADAGGGERQPTGTAGRETAEDARALNQYAEKTLPTLRTHLQRAQKIQASLR